MARRTVLVFYMIQNSCAENDRPAPRTGEDEGHVDQGSVFSDGRKAFRSDGKGVGGGRDADPLQHCFRLFTEEDERLTVGRVMQEFPLPGHWWFRFKEADGDSYVWWDSCETDADVPFYQPDEVHVKLLSMPKFVLEGTFREFAADSHVNSTGAASETAGRLARVMMSERQDVRRAESSVSGMLNYVMSGVMKLKSNTSTLTSKLQQQFVDAKWKDESMEEGNLQAKWEEHQSRIREQKLQAEQTKLARKKEQRRQRKAESESRRRRVEEEEEEHTKQQQPEANPDPLIDFDKVDMSRQELIAKREADTSERIQKAMEDTQARRETEATKLQQKLAVGEEVVEKLHRWANNTDGSWKDVRTLLSTVQEVLWEDADWETVSVGSLMINSGEVKKRYRKALLMCHPDRHQHTSAERQLRAERIFQALNESFKNFS